MAHSKAGRSGFEGARWGCQWIADFRLAYRDRAHLDPHTEQGHDTTIYLAHAVLAVMKQGHCGRPAGCLRCD